MGLRKKTIEAIYIEESGDMGDSSALFFDGRKFPLRAHGRRYAVRTSSQVKI